MFKRFLSPRHKSDALLACWILSALSVVCLFASFVLRIMGNEGVVGAGAGIAIAITTPWTAYLLYRIGSLAITAEIAHKFALHSRQIDLNTLNSLHVAHEQGSVNETEFIKVSERLENGIRLWDAKISERSGWVRDLSAAGHTLVVIQALILGIATAIWALSEFIERALGEAALYMV